MSAINTALPRMRAATATDIEDSGEIPVPFSINTRTNATICKATKKKIVGGSNAKNSSLSLADSLDIELNCDESRQFHDSCFRIWLGRMRRALHDRRDQLIDKKAGGLLRAARREVHFCYWLGPLLAASACCIFFAISALTASRLKLAPLCIGGKSRKVWSSLPITCWTNTKRQN